MYINSDCYNITSRVSIVTRSDFIQQQHYWSQKEWDNVFSKQNKTLHIMNTSRNTFGGQWMGQIRRILVC